jgi:hypothetical protein
MPMAEQTMADLDLEAVLRPAQALSEKQRLDDLLPAVSRILLAIAGADRAWLLRDEEGVLAMRAHGTAAGEQITDEVTAPDTDQVEASLPRRVLRALAERFDCPALLAHLGAQGEGDGPNEYHTTRAGHSRGRRHTHQPARTDARVVGTRLQSAAHP